MTKWMYILAVLVIAGFVVLGVADMMNSRMADVRSVADVRARQDQPLQFMGSIVPGKTSYDEDNDELIFRLTDANGVKLDVRYNGVKPPEFDTAKKALVRGSYNGSEFIAEEVLLKHAANEE